VLLLELHEQSGFVQPSKHLQIPQSQRPLPAQTTLKYRSHDSLSHSQYLPDILFGSLHTHCPQLHLPWLLHMVLGPSSILCLGFMHDEILPLLPLLGSDDDESNLLHSHLLP
jgi:hypothetical protein